MSDFGSTMTYTLIVTLFGMGIVFIVLILLQYILESMRIIFSPKKKEAAVQKVTPVAVEAAEPVQQAAAAEMEDEEELLAVIAAAVSCCMGTRSNIVVRSITRVYDQTPAWGRAGRSEQMQSRF